MVSNKCFSIASKTAIAVTMALGIAATSYAWEPTKTVEFVVPAGTGGGADQMGRKLAPEIRDGKKCAQRTSTNWLSSPSISRTVTMRRLRAATSVARSGK